jgi:hypothetical protein
LALAQAQELEQVMGLKLPQEPQQKHSLVQQLLAQQLLVRQLVWQLLEQQLKTKHSLKCCSMIQSKR